MRCIGDVQVGVGQLFARALGARGGEDILHLR
jgi:hypothetical protein